MLWKDYDPIFQCRDVINSEYFIVLTSYVNKKKIEITDGFNNILLKILVGFAEKQEEKIVNNEDSDIKNAIAV